MSLDEAQSPALSRRERKALERHALFEQQLSREEQEAQQRAKDTASANAQVEDEWAAAAASSSRGSSKAKASVDKRLRRGVERQDRNGVCVWQALLQGVLGLGTALDHQTPAPTHNSLLAHIKARVSLPSTVAALAELKYAAADGSPAPALSPQEVIGAVERLHVDIHGGYLTSACDPLFHAVAACFGVSIRHQLAETGTVTYRVGNARRIIHLHSSSGHMSFGGFRDL